VKYYHRVSTHLIADVLTDETLLVLDPLVPIRILPSEEWEAGDETRDAPNQEDHHVDPSECPAMDVVDGRDGPVPVAQQPDMRKLDKSSIHMNKQTNNTDGQYSSPATIPLLRVIFETLVALFLLLLILLFYSSHRIEENNDNLNPYSFFFC